jgi:hypothetical protein
MQISCSVVELESESIEIIREVTATATKPLMLYSIRRRTQALEPKPFIWIKTPDDFLASVDFVN